MEILSALLALWAGNSPVTGEFPTQRPVSRSFGIFFDLRANKRLSKQSWGWWFETPSRSLWRHWCWSTLTTHRYLHQQWDTVDQTNRKHQWHLLWIKSQPLPFSIKTMQLTMPSSKCRPYWSDFKELKPFANQILFFNSLLECWGSCFLSVLS